MREGQRVVVGPLLLAAVDDHMAASTLEWARNLAIRPAHPRGFILTHSSMPDWICTGTRRAETCTGARRAESPGGDLDKDITCLLGRRRQKAFITRQRPATTGVTSIPFEWTRQQRDYPAARATAGPSYSKTGLLTEEDQDPWLRKLPCSCGFCTTCRDKSSSGARSSTNRCVEVLAFPQRLHVRDLRA